MKKNGVTVYQGEGRVTAPGKVSVTGAKNEELSAKHIILATGSVPIDLPTMPVDGQTVVTSTEALVLRQGARETGRHRRRGDWPGTGQRLGTARRAGDGRGIPAAHRAGF